MKVIIINGSGGSGKDTVVELVKTYLYNDYMIENISTIDEVKKIARLMGWNGKKEDKDRTFLSNLKRIWKEYNSKNLDLIFSKISCWGTDEQYCPLDYIVFIHSREPEEIEEIKNKLLKKNYLVKTLLVRRNNIENFSNSSDKNVENYNYDFILENNEGLEELNKKCESFAKEIDNWK